MPRLIASIIPAVFALGACTTLGALPEERVGEATLRLASGLPVGNVQVVRNGDTLTLVAAVTGLEPGTRGFHLHTTGKCIAPDFSSAGGHLNPAGRTHGSMSPGGQHLGDLPNLVIGANRSGAAQIDLPGKADETLSQLFDGDGTAIVIHAKQDDYRTDPTGDAGGRVACGVLETR